MSLSDLATAVGAAAIKFFGPDGAAVRGTINLPEIAKALAVAGTFGLSADTIQLVVSGLTGFLGATSTIGRVTAVVVLVVELVRRFNQGRVAVAGSNSRGTLTVTAVQPVTVLVAHPDADPVVVPPAA